jgi:hypothetical protein
MNKTENLGCRVTVEILRAVDLAASAEGINRSEWLANAIARGLGKKPRAPLASRVAALEKRLSAIDGF